VTGPPSIEEIVDTALALAAERGWEAVRLHDVAARLSADLNAVRAHFREKEEIVDAWFDRADAAMLAAAPEAARLPPAKRLATLMMRWLDALHPQRRVTREMIVNKLEPGHVHYQWAGLLRVSRTVQWWREAAGRTAALPWRAVEESALTAIYLATFAHWMWDDSHASADTRRFLHARLRCAAGWKRRLLPDAWIHSRTS
jgi:AcrR family transcriptional regulator